MDKEDSQEPASALPEYRCPQCDSVVPEEASQCLMCGRPRDKGDLSPSAQPEPIVEEPLALAPEAVIESMVKERRSNFLFWTTAVLVGLFLLVGWVSIRDRAPEVMAAFIPTPSPLPPTPTLTPIATLQPTDTPVPTLIPTETPIPVPTSTPRDPRFHTVGAGETLIGLSLFYRISSESIAAANGFEADRRIQVSDSLQIPWPTATPPLESLLLEINGQTVLADVDNCEIITIQSGDSAYSLSANRNVPIDAIIKVNRQTMDSIQLLQPGDTLCIPRIVYTDTLPPTPGPSPTPLPTALPGGPELLHPANGRTFDFEEEPILLQWAAVKDLEPNEWYMVEMQRLSVEDSFPFRTFTRDSSLRIPAEWRPAEALPHHFRWQVSIVQATGKRSDGQFTYVYGGESSDLRDLTWVGAVPTVTPRPSPTITPVP